jgi:antitoxin component of MazEF toxin-antitoxin module
MSHATKKLTRTGNSVALVLERAWLEETGIDIDLPVEVSTHGDAIVVRRARTKQRKRKLAEVVADAHRRYGPVFKKLAE